MGKPVDNYYDLGAKGTVEIINCLYDSILLKKTVLLDLIVDGSCYHHDTVSLLSTINCPP